MREKKLFLMVLSLVMVTLLAGLLLVGCSQPAPPAPAAPADPADPAAPAEPAAPIETITLNYAFFAPANTFPGVQMEEWAKRVEERTGGQIAVDTFPGSTLLNPGNMYDGVMEGVAQIGLSCPSYEPGRFPLLELADMPVQFPNAKVASVVLYELIQEFQPESLQDFKVITAFVTEPAYIQSKTRVASLEDLRGLELRSAGTGVGPLRALGATPVAMGQGEVGEALQTGVIDGYASSREVLYDFKYAEIVKYVTDYPTFYISFLALMDINVWNSLPADVQAVIDELGREMAFWTGDYLDNHCVDAVEWAVSEEGVEVVTLSADEQARWDAALQPLVEEYVADLESKGLPGRAFVERLYELRDKYSAEFS